VVTAVVLGTLACGDLEAVAPHRVRGIGEHHLGA
jgi:hypothetical protein